MNRPDPQAVFDALRRRAETQAIIARTEAKAKRGAELGPWSLNVRRDLVAPQSSLALDDAGFMSDYAGDMVSGTAVFPIMSAVDGLTAINELIKGREISRESHAGSLLTLSRMATESAATTIWLLSSTDRAMRRGLSVRFTASELKEQRKYHSSIRKMFKQGPGKNQPVEYQKFLEHVRLFDERVEMLKRGENQTPKAKVPNNTSIVEAAAKWVDEHPPPHDTNGSFGREGYGFEDAATSFYTISSAIVHGLKWPLDYIPNGEVDLSRMIMEGVGIAVSMAECAVALFEAQAQNWNTETKRQILYPTSLQQTVEEWARHYPADPPEA
ncbi:MAG: hypothetical protein ACRC20_12305 [Segniliparus sp.]|uniref:hypothetical protein n=1 Tax=Segniliparus sp. TaxID=2804064 RepID=UPI003F380043